MLTTMIAGVLTSGLPLLVACAIGQQSSKGPEQQSTSFHFSIELPGAWIDTLAIRVWTSLVTTYRKVLIVEHHLRP